MFRREILKNIGLKGRKIISLPGAPSYYPAWGVLMPWAASTSSTEIADSAVCSFCEKCAVRSKCTHASFAWKVTDVHFVLGFSNTRTTAAAEYKE
jgi:hypothetical protein